MNFPADDNAIISSTIGPVQGATLAKAARTNDQPRIPNLPDRFNFHYFLPVVSRGATEAAAPRRENGERKGARADP